MFMAYTDTHFIQKIDREREQYKVKRIVKGHCNWYESVRQLCEPKEKKKPLKLNKWRKNGLSNVPGETIRKFSKWKRIKSVETWNYSLILSQVVGVVFDSSLSNVFLLFWKRHSCLRSFQRSVRHIFQRSTDGFVFSIKIQVKAGKKRKNRCNKLNIL